MKKLFLLSIYFAVLFLTSCSHQAKKEDSNPLFPVILNNKHGYIDNKGKIVIIPHFDEVDLFDMILFGTFLEGLENVMNGGKWGYIDKGGKYVINPQFDAAKDFSEGLAAVRIADKWGFIDKTGRLVINSQFDSAMKFFNGLAWISIDKKAGYINKAGKFVWGPIK